MPVDTKLAELSDTLLFAAVLAYVVAFFCYAVELAFGARRRAPAPIAGGSVDTLPADAAARLDADALATRAAPTWARHVGRLGVVATLVGWGLHSGSVVTRGLAADRVPWGNMYEFSSAVCLVAVSAFLVLLVRQDVRPLGTFVMLPVVLYLGLAGTVLYAPAAPLVPALHSYWIKIHVVAAMTASGLFMLGFAAAVVFLVKESWERRHGVSGTGILARLPAAASIDRVAHGVVTLAFPIWTFAVIAGAIWAEAAWGRYWGWDPKETWSFITWLVYAGYLHARATSGWKGRKAALVSIAGFVSLMITYFAVNLWISGLHSYAGV